MWKKIMQVSDSPVGSTPFVVELRGGLGNQLFQWAAGYSISQSLSRDLWLDASQIRQESRTIDRREYQLDFFGLGEANEGRVTFDLDSWRGEIPKKIFTEKSLNYDWRFEKIRRPLILRGYFQSLTYFSRYQESVRAILASESLLTENTSAILAELRSGPWVAVHVRRGDYLNLPKHFVTVGSDYYAEAFKKLSLQTGVSRVVFSESLEDAMQVVPGADLYLDSVALPHPGDVLQLLSRADFLIGANSTLSWWGTFLNQSRQDRKVLPEKWFPPSKPMPKSLIPADWNVI